MKDDERAVSPVIGFVLMFALVMIVFTLYQTNVVPAANGEVEFEHSQTVEGQMGQLSSAIIGTSSTGNLRSVTIATGVQYPSRALAINPGNPIGTLQSVPTPNVSVTNADTGDRIEDYTFDTSFLSYRPNYNRLNEETARTIENGMLSRTYSGTGETALVAENSVFTDSNITLVMMSGGLQRSQMTTTVTTSRVLSESVVATGNDSTTIELPTTLSEDTWRDSILAGTDHTIEDYRDPAGYTGSEEVRIITIGVDGSTGVSLSKLDPGGDNDSEDFEYNYYLENATPSETIGRVDEPTKVTVRVENQFGNPPSPSEGLTVEADVAGDDGGSLGSDTKTVNASGMATFTYNPAETDAGSNVTITASLQSGSENGPIEFEITYPELRLEAVTSKSPDASIGNETSVTVRTVDGDGNTLSGIGLGVDQNGSGGFTEQPASSNDSGLATFTYNPAESDAGSTVGVTPSLSNASNENDSVTFGLVYPPEESPDGGSGGSSVGDTVEPGDVTQPPITTSALARSSTHPSFRIEVPDQSNPIEITGFAIETKNDLSGVTETERPNTDKTHNFKVYQTGLSYESDTPLQLDGSVYMFDSEGAVTSSRVQIERFDSRGGIRLRDQADSYTVADVTIWFILTDGTVRPVYFDATAGPGNR